MDIGNQISQMCNESDCVNRYWNLVSLMVEAMSSVISTQNYNIASLTSCPKWILILKESSEKNCRQQSKSLIKHLINEKKGIEVGKGI